MVNKASQMKTAGFTIGALSGALAIGFGLLNKSVVGRVALKGQEAISTIGAGVAAAVSLSSLSVGIAGAVKERKITRQNQEPRSRNASQGDGDSDSGEILGEQAYEALIRELVTNNKVGEERERAIRTIQQVIREELEESGTPLTKENVIAAARRLKEKLESSAESQQSSSSSEGESSEASTSTGGAEESSSESSNEADSAPVPGKEIPLDETYSEVTEELKRVNPIYDRLGVSAVTERQAIRDLIFTQGKKETEENIKAAMQQRAAEVLKQAGIVNARERHDILTQVQEEGVALTKENLQSAAQQYRLAEATELVRRAVRQASVSPSTDGANSAGALVPSEQSSKPSVLTKDQAYKHVQKHMKLSKGATQRVLKLAQQRGGFTLENLQFAAGQEQLIARVKQLPLSAEMIKKLTLIIEVSPNLLTDEEFNKLTQRYLPAASTQSGGEAVRSSSADTDRDAVLKSPLSDKDPVVLKGAKADDAPLSLREALEYLNSKNLQGALAGMVGRRVRNVKDTTLTKELIDGIILSLRPAKRSS